RPGAWLRAQAEGAQEVVGHEAGLDFGRRAQQMGQLVAGLDDDVLLTRHGDECRTVPASRRRACSNQTADTVRAVPVPLPSEAKVNLQPPEAREVGIVAQGIIGAVARAGGLTDLQKLLIKATLH